MTGGPRTTSSPRSVAVVAFVLVAMGAALGVLGGWLWYQWWGPPNTGQVYDTETWGPRWLDLSDQGLAHQFDGPAQYAVVALALGSLLGIVGVVVGGRQGLGTLVGLALGAALAAYLSYVVGTALSPPDPQQYATAANVGEEFPAAIEVSGWTPFLCWPIAAFGALTISVAAMASLERTRAMVDEIQPLPKGEPVREPDDRPVP